MDNELILKKVSSEDDFKYFSQVFFNEDVMLMNYGRVFTLEEAKKCYKGILKNSLKYNELGSFKVFINNTEEFIGICSININESLDEVELEYLLLPQYWGNGYGTEIARILLNICKKITSVKKASAIIDPKNIASRKILEKYGFKSESIFRIDDGSLAETLTLIVN